MGVLYIVTVESVKADASLGNVPGTLAEVPRETAKFYILCHLVTVGYGEGSLSHSSQ